MTEELENLVQHSIFTKEVLAFLLVEVARISSIVEGRPHEKTIQGYIHALGLKANRFEAEVATAVGDRAEELTSSVFREMIETIGKLTKEWPRG